MQTEEDCGIRYKKGETKAVLGGDLFHDNKMTKFFSEKIVQQVCCGDQFSPGGGIAGH